MFEILTLVVFVWILIKSVGLMLRLTWGAAKIIATVLLIPIALVCLAGGILRACV